MRLRISFSDSLARGGRSILISLISLSRLAIINPRFRRYCFLRILTQCSTRASRRVLVRMRSDTFPSTQPFCKICELRLSSKVFVGSLLIKDLPSAQTILSELGDEAQIWMVANEDKKAVVFVPD